MFFAKGVLTTSDTLLKATLNRLSAKLGEKLIETAEEIAVITKEAPDKLKKEWENLKDEIYEEAERLQNESNQESKYDSNVSKDSNSNQIQEKIDQIRTKVTELNQRI